MSAANANTGVLALLLARGGSKGVPGKNLRPLAGVPLLAYSVAAARAAPSVGRVVITTDSPEIATVACSYGAEAPFLRPAELARDDSPSIDAVIHALDQLREREGYEARWVVLLQPTSPLRRAQHIETGLLTLEAAGADSLVSVVKVKHHPAWCYVRDERGLLARYAFGAVPTRRQDLPEMLALNGALYIATPAALHSGDAFGERCVPLVMGQLESQDIDTADDFALCEALIAARVVEPEPVPRPQREGAT